MRFLFEFDDGLRVEFTGSVLINKGDEIRVYIKEGFVPDKLKEPFGVMERISGEVRDLVRAITDEVGTTWYVKDDAMGEGRGVWHE
jgi:hypothetical protein